MSDTITLEGASRSTGAGRKAYVPVTFQGRAAVGYIYATGVGIDHEHITIGTRLYEFVTTLGTGTAGEVEVDIVADQTADYACDALVAAINSDADRVVDAIAWAGNADAAAGVSLVSRTESNTNPVLVEATTNFQVSAATLEGGAVPAATGISGGTYGVTARDVLALALAGGNEIVIGAITTTRQPTLVSINCMTAANVVKALATVEFAWRQVNNNYWVLTVHDAAAVLANGDIIGFILGY